MWLSNKVSYQPSVSDPTVDPFSKATKDKRARVEKNKKNQLKNVKRNALQKGTVNPLVAAAPTSREQLKQDIQVKKEKKTHDL